jgi:hypothetical protein
MADKQKTFVDAEDFTDADKVPQLVFWNYKEKKEIMGVVVDINEEGQYGRTITLDTNEANGISLPNLATLNTKLKNVQVGNKLKIVNLGTKKSSETRRDYYDFDVWII